MDNKKRINVVEPFFEKLPPQSLEAEMAVLGAMLMEKEAIYKAVEMVSEETFYKDAHRKIFRAILSLFDKNEPVDLVTLTEKLKETGNLDEVGGPGYLATILNSVPTAANIDYYLKIIQDKALLRALLTAATNIVEMSYQQEGEAFEILDKAEQMIFNLVQRKTTKSFVPLKELLHDSFEVIEALYAKKRIVTGVPSGFKEFDVLTSGFQPSDLIIIAGRPSMGKTSFALNIAQNVGVRERLPVAIFSLEMSKEQLVQRMLCAEARVDAIKLRTGYLSESDWPRLTTAAGVLNEAEIFIDDTPAISDLELRAKARRLKASHDIKLIIVDYLQLMKTKRKTENRQQEIAEISRSLKSLARELNVPLIALSQLSRAVEARQERRPQLSDLRESGALEQDADLVAFVYRRERYHPEEDKGIAEIIVGKQRNGPTGVVKLAFIKEYARFENLAPA
jgi:replicative DNA helicase